MFTNRQFSTITHACCAFAIASSLGLYASAHNVEPIVAHNHTHNQFTQIAAAYTDSTTPQLAVVKRQAQNITTPQTTDQNQHKQNQFDAGPSPDLLQIIQRFDQHLMRKWLPYANEMRSNTQRTLGIKHNTVSLPMQNHLAIIPLSLPSLPSGTAVYSAMNNLVDPQKNLPILNDGWSSYDVKQALFARTYKTVPNRDYLNDLPFADGGEEWACLTEALYFEARGESISGIFAVAEVIINRRDHSLFPDSVCKVISQGAKAGRRSCQFSYKCDGLPESFNEAAAYRLVGKIAKIALEERGPMITAGATFYHSEFVSPYWARKFTKTTKIGKHLFYRS